MRVTLINTLLLLISACWFTLPAMASAAREVDGTIGQPESIDYSEWIFDGFVELTEIPEPSGMCFHPGRNTLFVVDDGNVNPDGSVRLAALFEVDLHATVLAKLELGHDLEGVCYCSRDGMLYVSDETDETVYVVDPDGLTLIRSFRVSRRFDGHELLEKGGNGFEGIEYIEGDPGAPGYFLLLNQDDPHALVRIDYDDTMKADEEFPAPIISYHKLPKINLGELHYDRVNRELWVVHSWMNVIEILDIDSLKLKRWEICPGAAQEALAFDAEGRLWIGYDLGGISRYLVPGNDTDATGTE